MTNLNLREMPYDIHASYIPEDAGDMHEDDLRYISEEDFLLKATHEEFEIEYHIGADGIEISFAEVETTYSDHYDDTEEVKRVHKAINIKTPSHRRKEILNQDPVVHLSSKLNNEPNSDELEDNQSASEEPIIISLKVEQKESISENSNEAEPEEIDVRYVTIEQIPIKEHSVEIEQIPTVEHPVKIKQIPTIEMEVVIKQLTTIEKQVKIKQKKTVEHIVYITQNIRIPQEKTIEKEVKLQILRKGR
jgi:hypothetical protein